MALDADAIVDRRRLKRRLSLWRAAAIVIAAGLAIALLLRETSGFAGDAVARVTVSGVIGQDDEVLLDALETVAGADRFKALIVRIDSPGGTTAGSEALHEAIRRAAEKRPVVGVLDGLAASGGYVAAIATDHIVARGNTLTGSIGVIFQATEISQLLETVGVEVNEVKSAPLKAEPSFSEPLRDDVRAALEVLIADGFDWFVDLVAERRNLTRDAALEVADGRVFSGRQALELKLIDEIGGERAARAWLASEKGVSEDLPVVDVDRIGGLDRFSRLADAGARAFDGVTAETRMRMGGGLLSIWRP